MKTPSQPSPRQTWRRAAQTVALVVFAFSLNGWQYNTCSNKTTTENPLNGRDATRLYVDVQPPEMRPLVRRLTVEVNSTASTSSWTQVGTVTGLSGNPTYLDVNPGDGPQYRIQARDTCDQLLAETVMATAMRKDGDHRIGPNELTATLTVPSGAVPCSPSPSPSASVSPSPSPSSSASPTPSPSTTATPTPSPTWTPTPYTGGGGGGGGGGTPPSASVTVNLNGQIQRGRYATSEGGLDASPSASVPPSASPTPSAWLSASPSPSI